MGVQMRMRRRSVEARLARKVLVGDLNDLFCITVKMISRLPSTPSANITLGCRSDCRGCETDISIRTKAGSKWVGPPQIDSFCILLQVGCVNLKFFLYSVIFGSCVSRFEFPFITKVRPSPSKTLEELTESLTIDVFTLPWPFNWSALVWEWLWGKGVRVWSGCMLKIFGGGGFFLFLLSKNILG